MAKKVNASSGRMPTRIAGLTLGIAIGVAGAVHFAPNDELELAQSELSSTSEQLRIAQATNASNEAYIGASGPMIVANKLFNLPVIVMTTSDAKEEDVAAVEGLLENAGIVKSGRIALQPSFFAQDTADQLNNVVTQTLPAGVQISTTKLDPGTHAGEVLGAALLPATNPADRGLVLNALIAAGFIEADLPAIVPTANIILITGDGDVLGYPADALAAFAQGMEDQGSQVVLAGRIHTAADGGAIDQLRKSTEAGRRPSTVDNISTPVGRIATVLASAEQTKGEGGAYGIAASASAVCPPFVLS
ncbi:MAG: copper transporter [Corynebacterium sp.]|nr:copper transporter [Corynebacterium sp.]